MMLFLFSWLRSRSRPLAIVKKDPENGGHPLSFCIIPGVEGVRGIHEEVELLLQMRLLVLGGKLITLISGRLI